MLFLPGGVYSYLRDTRDVSRESGRDVVMFLRLVRPRDKRKPLSERKAIVVTPTGRDRQISLLRLIQSNFGRTSGAMICPYCGELTTAYFGCCDARPKTVQLIRTGADKPAWVGRLSPPSCNTGVKRGGAG